MSDKTEQWKKITKLSSPINRIISYDKVSGIEKVDIEGSLMVWWIPQIPMTPFLYPVNNIREAELLLDSLAMYDLFQLKHNIKPDYSNVGGLMVFEDDDWCEWCDVESGDNIDDFLRNKRITEDEK